jgi:hypothetical protein
MLARIAIAAAVIAAAATSTSASSNEFIHRKPGLWTTKMSLDSVKQALPETKMCLDAATDDRLMEHAMNFQKGACDKPVMSGMGAVRTVDSVCHINKGTQSTHMVVTYSGDAAYHIDVVAHFSPAQMGRDSMHSTQDAKWQGPCPADMKPGDMMIGPMKINVLDGGMSLGHGHLTKEQIEAMMKAHHQ